MLNNILKLFMLAQTEQEKSMTILGLAIFGFFLFVLVLDSLAKGKLIPKKGPLKKIVIFFAVVVAIVFFYYILFTNNLKLTFLCVIIHSF